SILNVHLLSHNNEKTFKYEPFKCSICSKTFNRKDHLNIHLRSHNNYKPFTCSFCSKSFTGKSNLNVHLRLHNNERPFKCSLCSKSFADKSNLNVHLRRCDYKFINMEVTVIINGNRVVPLKEVPLAQWETNTPKLQFPALQENSKKKYPPSSAIHYVFQRTFKTQRLCVRGNCTIGKAEKFNNALLKSTGKSPEVDPARVACSPRTNAEEMKLSNEKPFIVISRMGELNKHLLTHCNETPFKCSICIHSMEKSFKCSPCYPTNKNHTMLDLGSECFLFCNCPGKFRINSSRTRRADSTSGWQSEMRTRRERCLTGETP
ncbi:hypothetical protein L9F63_012753, partial [Diploptera punctata]